MKIIGKAGSGEFIVTASEDEMAKIAGYGSMYEIKSDCDKPTVGREVQVSELWRALKVSRERKADIATLAESLRKVAGRVDSINQALAAPIVEVKTA